jgi:hypothetical protein
MQGANVMAPGLLSETALLPEHLKKGDIVVNVPPTAGYWSPWEAACHGRWKNNNEHEGNVKFH